MLSNQGKHTAPKQLSARKHRSWVQPSRREDLLAIASDRLKRTERTGRVSIRLIWSSLGADHLETQSDSDYQNRQLATVFA